MAGMVGSSGSGVFSAAISQAPVTDWLYYGKTDSCISACLEPSDRYLLGIQFTDTMCMYKLHVFLLQVCFSAQCAFLLLLYTLDIQ